MASKKATFPGPRCKNAIISIEGLIWMATLVSSVLMISVKSRILYEFNQYRLEYRKPNNVDWEDFYARIQLLTEEKVPKLATLKVTLSN